MIIKNIKWDVDFPEDLNELPKELPLPEQFYPQNFEDSDELDEILDEVSDWLSDTYGYCHDGFTLETEEEDMNKIFLAVSCMNGAQKLQVYNFIKKQYVSQDVENIAKENNIELSEGEVNLVTNWYVDDCKYDCNTSYNDNLMYLICKAKNTERN